ncbi:MAG TPA: hypothetical protein IAB57_01040 [Candidatus Fimivivens faecavium]|nr:hypothetical protein [Candidatus Fimivivens faecavium]
MKTAKLFSLRLLYHEKAFSHLPFPESDKETPGRPLHPAAINLRFHGFHKLFDRFFSAPALPRFRRDKTVCIGNQISPFFHCSFILTCAHFFNSA